MLRSFSRQRLPSLLLALSCPLALPAELLVELDATSLPNGPLETWTNTGSVPGDFVREIHTPVVITIDGVNGVMLDGDRDWYVGPTAPPSVTGNGSRTIFAWVWNPSHGVEETVFSWSRRGGPQGTHTAFTHGYHGTWGAVAHWDSPDMSWNGTQEAQIWTCIAYTYDNATGITAVYTNGQMAASKPIAPLNVHAVSTFGQPLPFVVGCQNAANGTRDNNQHPGSLAIAKILVHDRALSVTEIAEAYNADAELFGRDTIAMPVSIGSFSASTEAAYLGDEVTLSWQVEGATSLSLDPDVTVPEGENSVVVSPTATTTYKLTASNDSVTESRAVTVLVLPGEPVAYDQSVAAEQDTPQAITLTGDDPNPPPGGLAWHIVQPPAHGTLDGEAPALNYTPAEGFHGTDSFTFLIHDGVQESNTATVSIAVNSPPSDPTGVTVSSPTIPASAVEGSFVAHLRAVDPNFGETHSFELVSGEGDTHNDLFAISGNQLIAQSGFAGQAGQTLSIRIKITDSTGRGVEQVLTFPIAHAAENVVINEIFYDPPRNARTEFIELHNPAEYDINISGWRCTSGVSYTFPPGSVIPAGGYAVVAMDPAEFLLQFGFAPYGPWSGRLSGDGERVELTDAGGTVVDEVDYKPEFPWPISAKADGASIELIHHSLDNDLGGSWRGSGSDGNEPEQPLVPSAATDWFYRPGTSMPPQDWRQPSFSQDGTWVEAQTPIGYGEVDGLPLNTHVPGMNGNYLSLFARRTFTIAPGEKPGAILLRYSMDDGIIIWINGVQVARRHVGGSNNNPNLNTAANTVATEGLWYEELLTNGQTLLNEGTNVIAVRVFNQSLSSSDLGFDVALIRPAGESIRLPSPGERNTVYSETAPPQIRQVRHAPQQPASGEETVITAKITDPQGVGAVELLYQIVEPGNFIPARFPRTVPQVMANPKGERPANPAFEDPANWTAIPMTDDGSGRDAVAGDGIFTAVIPAQPHRTLVRYRIRAGDIPGESLRVPYPDDPSLNFAYFVYNGVPDYLASTASVHPSGAGKVWPKALLASLPVYHWIIRPQDMLTLQAFNGSEQFPNDGTDNTLAARRAEEWEGAFVYDGIVYDHVCTRLRGGNSRYGDNEGRFTRGKRHYKFQFNEGHRFQARDNAGRPYPQKWKSLAFSKMFGNKGGNNWGMTEEIGSTLWSTFGVPAPSTHWFHFRVIDDAEEAPDQYHGDFWGIQQVVEEYESTFLDARGIEKGNLYKMSDWIWDSERQRRYQSPDMVRDGSEFNNIRDNLHGGQDAAWLQEYVDYDKWYRYSAVAEAIRHYDLFPYTENLRHSLKNLAWYFEPTGSDPARGRCWFLPYDWDASFGPNWNNGWEHANNALYGWDMSTSFGMPYINKPEMKLEHRNVIREFRDLIWQPDQLEGLMDHRAAVIAEISKADQDRWRNAPLSAGTANDDTLAYKVQDMKNFCFTGWSGPTGPAVGPGGRAAYLTNLADNADAGQLPARPAISYTGEPGHPASGLSFQCSAFVDPQGPHTFAAMAWRIGEIFDPAAPAHDPTDFILEYTPVWESGILTTFDSQIAVPAGAILPGRSYRARVRMQDHTGRWSRWSEPYQFTATEPAGLEDLQAHLVIAEFMYNPPGPALPGGSKEDFEFIELLNTSDTLTLDLTHVRFTRGIEFDFADAAITTLPPGRRVLIVKNLAAFESRYGTGLPLAGAWRADQNLSNSGERLTLAYGADLPIRDFTYGDSSPWPVAADGGGHSLVLIDPFSTPDHALPENWKASDVYLGTPGGEDSRFGDWLMKRGESDPDTEAIPGMSLLMMYALGGDLVSDPRSALPVAGFAAGEEGDHLTLSYRRRLDTNEVAWQVETSTNLETWQSDGEVLEETGAPIPNFDGTETVTVRVVVPVSETPARFIRLKVTLLE